MRKWIVMILIGIAGMALTIYGFSPVGDAYVTSTDVGESIRSLVVCQDGEWPFTQDQMVLGRQKNSQVIFVGNDRSRFRKWLDEAGILMGDRTLIPMYWVVGENVYQFRKTDDDWRGHWEVATELPEAAQKVQDRAENAITLTNPVTHTSGTGGSMICTYPVP